MCQVPRFTGDSYLQYTMADEDSVRHSTEIELEVRLGPEAGDGMILWLGVDPTADDYLGLGVEDGLLKVVWNLGWFSRTELVIPDTNLTDSSWHRVSLSRWEKSLILRIAMFVVQAGSDDGCEPGLCCAQVPGARDISPAGHHRHPDARGRGEHRDAGPGPHSGSLYTGLPGMLGFADSSSGPAQSQVSEMSMRLDLLYTLRHHSI